MLNWFGLVRMCDDDVLEFSSLLDRAAELYQTDSYIDSYSDGLVNHVLKNLLSSQNECYSLMGSRLMQRFLDRQGNSIYLDSPIIFYEFTQIKLVIGKYEIGDKNFIRHHRETIHVCILEALCMHCHSSINVKALFLILCVIVLEVPCGLTAAAAACIAMSVQDVALNGENISPTSRYWMHAIVISVMSLICWVHKSPVLYSYVNKIISRRAKEAPQLNPPLMHVYNIANHHVTWNKPTLFFEDWELRYGMWKHFAGELLFSVAILLIVVVSEGRGKKVVIHVPFKVKKIKHTHTVYKTVHHHHIDHAPLEEHEHFHHMHNEPPHGAHSAPVPGFGIPEFLPDVPDLPLELPDLPPPDMPLPMPPHNPRPHPNRHTIPLYRRKVDKNDR
ncbi:hypothetical protein O0L34_g2510 [Tuta absoluta]|nr:hypothetical protein O0L34_g2510 [Tuta absoluta]